MRSRRVASRVSKSTRDNLKWGVSHGLGIAALYAGLGLLRMLIRGISPFGPAGKVALAAITALVVVGLVAGTIVGLLRPHTRNPFGALLVGFLAAAPVVVLLEAVLVKGLPTTWANDDWAMTLILWPFVAAFLARQLYRTAKDASME